MRRSRMTAECGSRRFVRSMAEYGSRRFVRSMAAKIRKKHNKALSAAGERLFAACTHMRRAASLRFLRPFFAENPLTCAAAHMRGGEIGAVQRGAGGLTAK